jgi:putative effector of murein hydrolase LrgA (UPF0299 family)
MEVLIDIAGSLLAVQGCYFFGRLLQHLFDAGLPAWTCGLEIVKHGRG